MLANGEFAMTTACVQLPVHLLASNTVQHCQP